MHGAQTQRCTIFFCSVIHIYKQTYLHILTGLLVVILRLIEESLTNIKYVPNIYLHLHIFQRYPINIEA